MSTDWQSLIQRTRRSLDKAPGFSSGPVNVGDGERLASAGAGVALVGYGLKRRDGWGALSALGGLALLHRGYTGYCVVNDLMGRDSSSHEALRYGVQAKRSLRIDAPATEVCAAWEDAGGLPRLLHHLAEVHRLDARTARFTPRLTAQALGLPQSFDCERLMHESGKALVWRSVGPGPVRFELLVEAEEAPGGARMVLTAHYSVSPGDDPRRLSPDLGPMLDADLGRAGAVLQGLLSPREADVAEPEAAQAEPASAPDAEDAVEAPEPPAELGGEQAEDAAR